MRGKMTLTNAERNVLEKLCHLDEKGDLPQFTHDEMAAVKKIAKVMRGLEAIGWLAGSMRRFLTYAGIILVSWISIKTGFLEWIKGNL